MEAERTQTIGGREEMKTASVILAALVLTFYPTEADDGKTSYYANIDASLISEEEPLKSVAIMLYGLFSSVPQAMEDNGLVNRFNDFSCDEAHVSIDAQNGKVRLKLIGRNTTSQTPFQELRKDQINTIQQLYDDLRGLTDRAEKEGIETYFIESFVIKKGGATIFKHKTLRTIPRPDTTPIRET